jgi:acetylornithine deacetylase
MPIRLAPDAPRTADAAPYVPPERLTFAPTQPGALDPLPDGPLAASALLRRVAAVPTLSREEGPLADLLYDWLTRRGVHVGRVDDNVVAWIGEGDDLLLMASHLDVVPPSATHPHGAWDGYEADGELWGRGTTDAKASGAAMLTALLSLHDAGYRPPGGTLAVALTACEETGHGYNGLETLRAHLPTPSAALVGEPTEMQPCLAQKGLLILHLRARGTSAHAARPHLGDNAIARAARDLRVLDGLTFPNDPLLGPVTLTPTVIEGGSASNVVPDACTVTLDIRSTPAVDHDALIAAVEAAVESDVHVHSRRLVPVGTDARSRIAQACLAALPGAQPFGSPTMSDWLFLRDVPTVKIGPSRSELSHTPHERVRLADVDAAARQYVAIARAYFAG